MDGLHCLTLSKMAGEASTGAFDARQVRSFLLEAAERVVAHRERHQMLSRDLQLVRDDVQRLKASQAVQGSGASRFAHVEIRPSTAAGSGR
jgi:hypothetical protein